MRFTYQELGVPGQGRLAVLNALGALTPGRRAHHPVRGMSKAIKHAFQNLGADIARESAGVEDPLHDLWPGEVAAGGRWCSLQGGW